MITTPNIKWLFLLSICAFSLVGVFLQLDGVAAASDPGIRVTVEGKPVSMPVPPVIVDDRTLVGVRFIGEAVGGTVEWEPVKRQAIIRRHTETVVLTLGRHEALVNGTSVRMEVPAQLIAERTMVPLRFIAEVLGGGVEWNGQTRTANVLRKPTQITNVLYVRDVGVTRLTLTLSEPLLRIEPASSGSDFKVGLYPAELRAAPILLPHADSLLRGIHFAKDGRSVVLQTSLWGDSAHRQVLSPDGTELTLEFDHTVLGAHLHHDGRIPVVHIAGNGQFNYSTHQLDNPPRLVIDMAGARLSPEMPASINGSGPLVKRIRSSQFSRNPDSVRVVLDLEKRHPYEIISTELGLQIRFPPQIQAVKTEKLAGKSRITFTTSLPVDPQISLSAGAQPKLSIAVPQAVSGLKENHVPIGDGTIHAIDVVKGSGRYASAITISLPYYLSHTVLSKSGEAHIVVDLVTSPVFGKRIWVDAGHGKVPGGKDDPGAIGPQWGLKEKDINLRVSLELQKRLEAAGAIVFMTRIGDEGIDFKDRPDLVNRQKPQMDLFVSVHHNSALNRSARGTETWYYTNNPKSKVAADLIHPQILKALGFPDRKVRLEAYKVLTSISVPAVLLELGYLSHPDEERAITEPGVATKTYHIKATDGIVAGLFDYFWHEMRTAAPSSR